MTESVKNELSDICRIIDATVDTEKIYLFGSYAYGTPTDDSDYDLCVIIPENSLLPSDLVITRLSLSDWIISCGSTPINVYLPFSLSLLSIRKGNPLVRLKEYFDEFEIIKDAEELEFMGGLVGSLGYDYIRYTENLPDDNEDEIGIETIQLMLASKFISISSL